MRASFYSFGFLVATALSLTITSHVNTLDVSSFKPVKDSYWTGYPHHRRTPFALSPDGKTAYLAYLDASNTGVHIQAVDPLTFAATGTKVTIANGNEAGGLVAHNDGFAILTNEKGASGTDHPVPVLYRYTNGQQTFRTLLGLDKNASPDLNGDLVFSESANLYAAYFVVTAYKGFATGHFGDSIQYITTDGKLEQINGASSEWGCSHNTGIALEAADSAPFPSICAEDQGAIWLNTGGKGMSGVKISNEKVINGGSNEPMGGMSGSYSGLTRFIGSDALIFSWVSRGAVNLKQNTWLGGNYVQADARTTNRNIAIATFKNKNTLNGPQAISTVGAASGDDQVTWLTQGTADVSNSHTAAFDSTNALVTWEEAANPTCPFPAMGCYGTFTGTRFQQVDSTGKKVNDSTVLENIYVAGDMVTYPDGKICWPYVDMPWSLGQRSDLSKTTTKMSFACARISGAPENPTAPSSTASIIPTSSTTVSSKIETTTVNVATTTESVADSTILAIVTSTTTTTTSTISTMETPKTLVTITRPTNQASSTPRDTTRSVTSIDKTTTAVSSLSATKAPPVSSSTAPATSKPGSFQLWCRPRSRRPGSRRVFDCLGRE